MKIIKIVFLLFNILCANYAVCNNRCPVDTSKYHIGKLENGLTYYIIHNERPSGKADFYLINKAGAIKEKASHSGVSHIIEHQAFTETEQIPDEKMTKFLENIVHDNKKYGGHSSYLYTLYKLTDVSIDDKNLIDSSLFLLKEWSSNIKFSPNCIEKNRNVLCAEILSRNIVNDPLLAKAERRVLNKTCYHNHSGIGQIESIRKISAQEIMNYYNKWYSPELQAIIVSGSIDVKEVESKICKLFGDIKPKNAKKTEKYTLPSFKNKSNFIIECDSSARNTIIKVGYRQPMNHFICQDSKIWHEGLTLSAIICKMIENRLNIAAKTERLEDAKFDVVYEPLYKNLFNTSNIDIIYKSSTTYWKQAIDIISRELKRILLYGFTDNELHSNIDKFSRSALVDVNNSYRNNIDYANSCINHFVYSGHLCNQDSLYKYTSEYLKRLRLEDVNKSCDLLTGSQKPDILVLTHPSSIDGKPTKKHIRKVFKSDLNKLISPWTDYLNNQKNDSVCFLSQDLNSNAFVVSKDTLDLKIVRIMLSNNVQVIIKNSNANGIILAQGFLHGGRSVLPDSLKYASTYITGEYANSIGYGNLSTSQVYKWYEEQQIINSCLIDENHIEVKGQCHMNNVENYLKSLYYSLTDVNNDSIAIARHINNMKDRSLLVKNNIAISQESSFRGLYYNTKFLNRDVSPKAGLLNEAFKKITSNFNGFTLVLTGNTNIPNLDNLLVRYLGKLPSKEITPMVKTKDSKTPDNDMNYVYAANIPLNTCCTSLHYCLDTISYTGHNYFLSEIAQRFLREKLTNCLRQKAGLVYDVSTKISMSYCERPQCSIDIVFSSYPDDIDRITNVIDTILKSSDRWTIDNSVLTKYKNGYILGMVSWTRNPQWWLNRLFHTYYTSVDFYGDIGNDIQSITPDEIRKFISNMSTTGRRIRVTAIGKYRY